MNIQTSISLIALLLAIGGNITWLFFTYGNSEKRKLAAERDFNHLRNNQQSISDGIAHGFDDIEHKLDAIARDLLEIRIWIMRNVKQPE
ncbi:hypothetical protein H6G33_17930 [Calothrix sp. FACHB-1219]|uniref:hypothetical protein n=1 Tax=unclassified Calothrix TaxID=2619626 RepID=UPI001689687E|nr:MULTISPECIES: hypothetical protein [unclassified Calothrix]MBD2202759.1 hypothetical protein [Calothrix sp. FACHB-168]MBD2218912.1 hypothetical protein [Calothrix sp. FACHB-1219]